MRAEDPVFSAMVKQLSNYLFVYFVSVVLLSSSVLSFQTFSTSTLELCNARSKVPLYHLAKTFRKISTNTKRARPQSWIATAQDQLSEKYLKESNGFQKLLASIDSVGMFSDATFSYSAADENKVLFEYGNRLLVSNFEDALSSSIRSLVDDELVHLGERPLLKIKIPASIDASQVSRLKSLYADAHIAKTEPRTSVRGGDHASARPLCEICFCEPQAAPAMEQWLQGTVEKLGPPGHPHALQALALAASGPF